MTKKFAGVIWYCDNCNACLESQSGFDDSCGFWTCKVCGFENSITEDNIILVTNEYYDDEYDDDEFDDDDDDIPEGCEACGGPYPECMLGCPAYDD